ncbi:hypothetical protein EJ03DRAFT_366805 [Teratosphaeria nubilosa]|uniref:Uncharacterized protein n=1 Tax=Teratosphaeria nubilosa TaxID=161662 RepID=A0A6G1L1S0_9PEZI|nr:hypothetical protein EJ03DRAFT_366805 [Teratosphaeria nubilosa]
MLQHLGSQTCSPRSRGYLRECFDHIVHSVNMAMLIAARALQGDAGDGLTQLVIITISDLYSMRQRTLCLGLAEVVWAKRGQRGLCQELSGDVDH